MNWGSVHVIEVSFRFSWHLLHVNFLYSRSCKQVLREVESFFFLRRRRRWSNITLDQQESILANNEKWGLDIGSLDMINRALLYKWKWCFLNNTNDLWFKVIKMFHGNDVGFRWSDESSVLTKGVWVKIISTFSQLHD